MLGFHETGQGRPLLLLHGGGEDAGMLAPQAAAFAARGRRVIWYDRRGTGDTPRDGWPERGVEGHADDAADLLRASGAAGAATVLGFSSGGVLALALAARHPDLVSRVVAWEPAAVGMLPDGQALHAQIMAPAESHLAAHPGDWRGAFLVLLDAMSEGRADVASLEVQAMLANAEAMIRDDARLITQHAFRPGELPADRCLIAIGKGASPLHVGMAEVLCAQLGASPLVVDDADEHEIYVSRPDVLAAALGDL